MCMFGLTLSSLRSPCVCSAAARNNTPVAENGKLAQKEEKQGDLHVRQAFSEMSRGRGGAGGEEEMFYPLSLKAFLAGRRAPDLFHHRP